MSYENKYLTIDVLEDMWSYEESVDGVTLDDISEALQDPAFEAEKILHHVSGYGGDSKSNLRATHVVRKVSRRMLHDGHDWARPILIRFNPLDI